MMDELISQIANCLEVEIITSEDGNYQMKNGTPVQPRPLGLLAIKGFQKTHPWDIEVRDDSLECAVKTSKRLGANAADILWGGTVNGAGSYSVQLYRI